MYQLLRNVKVRGIHCRRVGRAWCSEARNQANHVLAVLSVTGLLCSFGILCIGYRVNTPLALKTGLKTLHTIPAQAAIRCRGCLLVIVFRTPPRHCGPYVHHFFH